MLLAPAFVAYYVGLACCWLAARCDSGCRGLALARSKLVPLAAPLLLSTDAWTYWGYGRIAAVHDGNPVPRSARRVPGRPGVSLRRARTGVTRPPSTGRRSRSPRSPLAALRASRRTLRPGSTRPSRRRRLVALGPRAWLSPRPAFACAFVGWNPLLAVHFAGGGGTTTRGWRRSSSVRSPGRRRPAGARPALPGRRRPRQVGAARLPAASRARGASRRARVGHLGFVLAAVAAHALATWRYGSAGWAPSGPSRENANQETSYALPHRLRSSGSRAPGHRRSSPSLFAAAFVVARPRGACAAARALALAACVLMLAAAVARALVPRLGGAARGRSRTTGRRSSSRSALGATCCPRRFRPSPPRRTSTPSSSKTSCQRGSRRSRRRRGRLDGRGRTGRRSRALLVDRDPVGVLAVREAEDPLPLGEVGAERVGGAHDGVVRDQLERSRRNPVVA